MLLSTYVILHLNIAIKINNYSAKFSPHIYEVMPNYIFPSNAPSGVIDLVSDLLDENSIELNSQHLVHC